MGGIQVPIFEPRSRLCLVGLQPSREAAKECTPSSDIALFTSPFSGIRARPISFSKMPPVCDPCHTDCLEIRVDAITNFVTPSCAPRRSGDIKDEPSRAIVASRAFYPNLSSLVRHLLLNRLKRLKLASATGLRFGDSGPRRV
jgi:hypothetical protein